MGLREISALLRLGCSSLVELHELLLMVEHFFQELLSSSASAELLTAAHLLLKAIKGPCFLLTMSEDASALVEISVDKLILKEVIAV